MMYRIPQYLITRSFGTKRGSFDTHGMLGQGARTLALAATAMAACAFPLSQSDEQRYVSPAREVARNILKDPLLAEILAALPADAIDHKSDRGELNDDSGRDVLDRLRATSLDFAVQCRRSANFKTWAWEGVETEGIRTVSLRCAWFERQSIAEWSGTLVHELAHHAGYLHDGNARQGNECTVPHLIADAVIQVASLRNGEPAKLGPDVCPALTRAVAAASRDK